MATIIEKKNFRKRKKTGYQMCYLWLEGIGRKVLGQGKEQGKKYPGHFFSEALSRLI